ncbi:MAG: hypothetical protein RMI90_14555 [Thermoguttaceae bacterium]|nr:hypothetical protein [Thermoguttaceae bacterium]
MEPDQEARLWELYYGLLCPEEAAELQRRIASDPQWAELWAQVQQRAALLAEAARVRMDQLPLPSRDSAAGGETLPPQSTAYPPVLSEAIRTGRAASRQRPSVKPLSATQAARWAVWVVYVSTALLLVVALWGALVHRHYLLALTGHHLRVMVHGPSVLGRGVENHFLVFTSRVDGQPVEAQVEFALFGPDQKRFFSQKETTDPQGQVRVVLPADMDLPQWVHLQVRAEAASSHHSHQRRLEVAPLEYQTFLGLDRLYYRAGEKLLFRSISVPRFGRRCQEEMWVEFEVRDAEGRPVPGLYQEGRTWQGIGCGEFRIPPDMPSGLYVLVARNAQRRFTEVRKPFWILPSVPPQFQLIVKFQKAPYRPGQPVTAQIHVQHKGQPLRHTPVEVRAELDGTTFYRDSLRTDGQGQCATTFRLPERFSGHDAWLYVKLPASPSPLITWKQIPLEGPKLLCQFYPEAGLLVPEVENRVYFSVRDDQGRPVEVRGQLLDTQGRAVAQAQTTHLGRGVLQFVPQKDQQYRFQILQPEGVATTVDLPPMGKETKLIIKTGLGVVPANQPLQVQLLTTPSVKTPLPLMAVVVCRGVQVARQWVVPQISQEGQATETPVQIPLPQGLWGLLQLRVYDYSQSPPVLLAERLLYRLPVPNLQIELGLPKQVWEPGNTVPLRLSIKGEQGTPISAIAGLSVVEETSLGTMPALAPISPFWWLDQLWEIPEDLQQAELFLADRPESHQTLDLLLGTWAGRVRTAVAEEWDRQLASNPRQVSGRNPPTPFRTSLEDAPPLVLDNLREILASYQEAKTLFQQARPETLNAITLCSLLGGAGLVLFVIFASLLQVAGGVRMWIPALLGATICVGIGLVLAHPEFLRPRSPYGLPFAEYPTSTDSQTSQDSGEASTGRPNEQQINPPFSSSVPARSADAGWSESSFCMLSPVHLEAGLVQPFGLPAMSVRQLLSIADQLDHPLDDSKPPKFLNQDQAVSPADSRPAKEPLRSDQGRSGVPTAQLPPTSASSANLPPPAPPHSAEHRTEVASAEPPTESSEIFSTPSGSRFVVRRICVSGSPRAGNWKTAKIGRPAIQKKPPSPATVLASVLCDRLRRRLAVPV